MLKVKIITPKETTDEEEKKMLNRWTSKEHKIKRIKKTRPVYG